MLLIYYKVMTLSNDVDYDIAFLSGKEVRLLLCTPEKECPVCEWIISKGLGKDKNGEYYIYTEQLDESDIEHLEQIINRKLIDGTTDMVKVNGRYTSNQS